MKKLISILGASFIWMVLIAPANSGSIGAGVAFHVGDYSATGTETEKVVTGPAEENNSTSVSEAFLGASVYAEYRTDNGWAVGIDYVPTDIELGSGKRIDVSTGADIAAAADTGTRSASAELDGLTTLYAHIPFGPVYVLLGYHHVDVTTTETLPTTSYGDVTINGTQIGIGMKSEDSRIRVQASYSDFDDISITGTGNTVAGQITGQSKVTADADALAFTVAIGF